MRRTGIALLVAMSLIVATTPALAVDHVVLDPIGDKEATVGEELTFTVTATGGTNIGFISDELPEGADIDIDSGDFAWIPAADQVDTWQFTIVAVDRDAQGNFDFTNSDSEAIEVTVSPAGGGDITPPEITITTPVDGAPYPEGAPVLAEYTCTDTESEVVSCVGDVPNGQAIETTPGQHSFTVSSTDLAGNASGLTHTYSVGGDTTAPSVAINTPPDNAEYSLGEVIVADYVCTDSESGVDTCVGDVPNGAAIETSTGGLHFFHVTGTDNAGNERTIIHVYLVDIPTDPVIIVVAEVVAVSDATAVIPPVMIQVFESVNVSDDASISGPVMIQISETVLVSDDPGIQPSVLITVSESVAVSDASTVTPEQLASLSGEKWEDSNGNGVRNSGESPLQGVVIYLDANDNGDLDPGEPWTSTNSSGQYLFTEVAPGSWVVREIIPNEYTQTFPDPDVDPAHRVTVGSSDLIGLDFGNQPVLNLPPVIAPIPDLTAEVGVYMEVRPHVLDPEGDPFTLRWEGTPSTAVTNGIFEWTPDVADAGSTYNITVTAVQTDNLDNTTSESFSITVEVPNEPLTIEPIGVVFGLPGQEIVVAPDINDPGVEALTYIWDGAPPNAISNGIFILTPTADQASQVFEITLTVFETDNPTNSAMEMFQVVVGSEPDSPDGVPSVNPVTPTPGGEIEVSGDGFQPGSTADVYLLSDPLFLGTVDIDETGSFVATLGLPPDMEEGAHDVVVVGISPEGKPRTLATSIEVVADVHNDGLTFEEEILTGTDPLNPDTDGDGLIDGLDASWLIEYLEGMDRGDFKRRWQKSAMKGTVAVAALFVNLGKGELALRFTSVLHKRIDGCGTSPHRNDWIVDCEAQTEFRTLLDLYERGIVNLPLPNPFGIE